MTRRARRAPRAPRALLTLGVWSALLLFAWLDRGRPTTTRAEFFGWLIPVLVSLGRAIGSAIGSLVSHSVSDAVKYLGQALTWLTNQFKSFLASTGAMFAKVWRSLEGFWKNVIRAGLLKLHDLYTQFSAWLKRTLKPIVDFLELVRARIKEIYKRFVRPVLDAIDAARRVLDILNKLHIPFAKQLDDALTKIEHTIVANYGVLLNNLNLAIDTINGLLTFDGYLQRFVSVRTFERDVFYLWRVLANSGTRRLTADELHRIQKMKVVPTSNELIQQSAGWWRGDTSFWGDLLDRDVEIGRDFWA